MRMIYSPDKIEIGENEKTIFLAGSIENGVAEDWQATIAEKLQATDLVLFNPRRQEWDASWVQSIDNIPFVEQVNWELDALERADVVMMNFVPKTISSISLLEFGLYARTGKLIVCCPEGYWKKGNVDVVCQKYRIRQVENLDELANHVLRYFQPFA
jgi:hypothetical protein